MKKVLIITYYFPPRGGVAVIRIHKFVKYLRDFGWEPVVLTVKQNYCAYRDEHLLAELPENLIIYYTKQPFLQRIIRDVQHQARIATPDEYVHRGTFSILSNKIYLLIRNIKNRLNKIIFLYDDYIGWKPIVLREIKRIVREHQIDILFTSCRPYSINMIGDAISNRYGIPWIADFRDPWTQDKRYFNPPTFLHRIMAEREEKKTMCHASKIVSVSEPMTSYFMKTYHNLDPAKFLTITNGYDGDEKTVSYNRLRDPERFIITYTGTFYLHQTPVWFYNAIRLFLEENPAARKHLIIRLVGKSQKDFEAYPYQIGIGDVIDPIGFIPHEQVKTYLNESDILLLVLYSDSKEYDFVYSGKFFEYLPVRKPILALLNHGVCQDFIQKHDLGICVPFSQVDQIKDALTDLFYQWRQGKFKYKLMSGKAMLRFHRRELTKQLAAVFDEVVSA